MNLKHHADDHYAMCGQHNEFTDTVGDAVMRIQDEAYALGRKRGKNEADSALLEAAKKARDALAVALAVSSPDLFETDADIAEHLTIKALDTAIALATGEGHEQ